MARFLYHESRGGVQQCYTNEGRDCIWSAFPLPRFVFRLAGYESGDESPHSKMRRAPSLFKKIY